MCKNTSLAAPGQSLPACNTAPPAKSKMAARGSQNGRRYTPSMRKVDNGENKKEKEKV